MRPRRPGEESGGRGRTGVHPVPRAGRSTTLSYAGFHAHLSSCRPRESPQGQWPKSRFTILLRPIAARMGARLLSPLRPGNVRSLCRAYRIPDQICGSQCVLAVGRGLVYLLERRLPLEHDVKHVLYLLRAEHADRGRADPDCERHVFREARRADGRLDHAGRKARLDVDAARGIRLLGDFEDPSLGE